MEGGGRFRESQRVVGRAADVRGVNQIIKCRKLLAPLRDKNCCK